MQGVPCGGKPSTIYSALQSNSAPGTTVTYLQGCNSVACTSSAGFAGAAAAAAASDVTIVAVGIDATFENEGLDRINITLPGLQEQLVQSVCAAAKGPCVLVLVSGGAVDISPVLQSVSSGGAWYTGLPGQYGAYAWTDLLFGDAVPAGRLTQTFYAGSFVEQVSLFDMGVRPGPSAWPPFTNPGRTYKWYTGAPAFPFGFGLSYTTFAVSDVSGPASLPLAPVQAYLASHSDLGSAYAPLTSETVGTYWVNVTNTGVRDADYVALGFLVPPGAGTGGVPLQELFGFQRVHVPAGQSVTVWLGLSARQLTAIVEDGSGVAGDAHPLAPRVRRLAAPGEYKVRFGVQAEGQQWSEMPVTLA